ncbi:MAG: LysR family transcriptional regulator [Betaproteobacteria bacterium]|nr:LysR family transcriptional regulator [Betaproteobacteria bacterium]
MELRDIEYFEVIAEHRNLGRAAEALGLGQPALSMSLRRLEKSAQAKLVKRTPKGVELTAVGSALLAHVYRLRLARDDLAREVADLAQGRAGHLRIGTGPATVETFLPAACSALLKDAPKVTLRITVADTDVLLPALHNGELDIVVTHIPQLPTQDLIQELLWDDEFVVYASVNHRLAKRKPVTPGDLVQERWATTVGSAFRSWQSLHRTFADHGLPPPQIALVSDSVMLRLRTVASCDLLGFSSRRVVQLAAPHVRVTIIPVKGMNWIRHVGVAYRKDAYLSSAARRFIEILKATARKITTGSESVADNATKQIQRTADTGALRQQK